MTHFEMNLQAAHLIRDSVEAFEGIHDKPIIFEHALADLAMMTDDHLAMIIERAAAAGPMSYNLSTVDIDEEGREHWVQGLLSEDGKVDGHAVLDLIKAGKLWLQVENLYYLAPHLYGLLKRAYDELAERLPNFSYRNLYCNLLISGPEARVTPHIDVAEVILFHIRGHKRMTLWDPERYPVPDELSEAIILRETLEDIEIPEEWKSGGDSYELAPGQGVSFPYLWPHSVDNLGDLNVSLQTEYHHPATIRRYGALYANGLLRRRLGVEPKDTGPGVLGESLRAAAGLAAKKLHIDGGNRRQVLAAFVVDKNAPDFIRRLPPEHAPVLRK